MKKCLLALLIPSFLAHGNNPTASNMLNGLPDDFKQYFYNSEIITQINLNDKKLFDASVSISNGEQVKLVQIIADSGEIDVAKTRQWEAILREGMAIGECVNNCLNGLMKVDFNLERSQVNIYTRQYETEKVQKEYITLPDKIPSGAIIANNLSAMQASSYRNMALTSELTSSFANWSQRVSFQSNVNSGKYSQSNASIYNLYTQKELAGYFLRMGMFSPDYDSGSVQTPGSNSSSIMGAMWGSSDALSLDAESVSAWPVYVTGRNQSIVEVWRDERLVYTQQLQTGIQALDTRRLPFGIYDVELRIIESGQVVETQQAQIYKPQGWANNGERFRFNLWGGKNDTIILSGDDSNNQKSSLAIGGAVDFLVHPRVVLGLSGYTSDNAEKLSVRTNIEAGSGSSFFYQSQWSNNENSASNNTDFRYYKTISGLGSGSLFYRKSKYRSRRYHSTTDTYGASMSFRLSGMSSLITNLQYTESAARKGLGVDVSATANREFLSRNARFRLSAFSRPGYSGRARDYGVSLGVSISLNSATQHIVSAETGFNRDEMYASANYQWQPHDSSIRNLGGGVSYSADSVVFSGNAAIDTPYLSGDMYAQHESRSGTNTAGGNLEQVLVLGGGKLASVNGGANRNMESALIVDVESDDKNASVAASSEMTEVRLSPGRNVIPVSLWKKNNIQFSASRGNNLSIHPRYINAQMSRGSVQHINIKAIKTITLVSMLKDENGNIIKNRNVTSDVSSSIINQDGILTLETGVKNKLIRVTNKNGEVEMKCELPSNNTHDDVNFIPNLLCKKV